MADAESRRKVFAGNLPRDVTKEHLMDLFGHYGSVEEVELMTNRGRSGDGCAIVKYSAAESAEDAVGALNGVYKFRDDDAKQILVQFYRPRASKAEAEEPEEPRLLVQSLPADIQEWEVKKIFSTYGEIVDMVLLSPKNESGQKKCYLTYSEMDSAREAAELLTANRYSFRPNANPIEVRLAGAWKSHYKGAGRWQDGGQRGGWSNGQDSWRGGGSWDADRRWSDKGSGRDSRSGKGAWSKVGQGRGDDGLNRSGGKHDSRGGYPVGDGQGGKGAAPGPRALSNKIRVSGGLPADIPTAHLEYVFGRYGSVLSIDVLRGPGRTRGSAEAIVTYATGREAEIAIASLRSYRIREGWDILVLSRITDRGAGRSAPY